jgi:hypothetical protein
VDPPLGVEVQPTNAKESQVNITRPSMREKYIRCIRYKTYDIISHKHKRHKRYVSRDNAKESQVNITRPSMREKYIKYIK